MRRTLVHPVNPRVKLLLFTEQFSALSKMLRLRGYLIPSRWRMAKPGLCAVYGLCLTPWLGKVGLRSRSPTSAPRAPSEPHFPVFLSLFTTNS